MAHVISLLLFLVLSHDMFLVAEAVFPPDYTQTSASLSFDCEDKSCDRLDLSIRSEGLGEHRLRLANRFTLSLKDESCSHHTGLEGQNFAVVRVCSKNSESQKMVAEGTFFDQDFYRYDFLHERQNKTYVMSRQRFDRQATGRALTPDDDSETVSVQEISERPVFGHFPHPVIELVAVIDVSVFNYFNQDEESVIRFACMNVLVSDALFRLMRVSVKLIGLRFLHKEGFNGKAMETYAHRDEVQQFFIKNLIDVKSRNSTKVPGVPDAIAIFTFRNAGSGPLGLAKRAKHTMLPVALVKPVSKISLTEETKLKKPHAIHFYPNGVTLAHELGHVLDLNHSLPDSGCSHRHGSCVMKEEDGWRIPFWLQSDVQSVGQRLGNELRFLMQRNVRPSGGESDATDSVTVGMRVLCGVTIILFFLILILFVFFVRYDDTIHYHRL